MYIIVMNLIENIRDILEHYFRFAGFPSDCDVGSRQIKQHTSKFLILNLKIKNCHTLRISIRYASLERL